METSENWRRVGNRKKKEASLGGSGSGSGAAAAAAAGSGSGSGSNGALVPGTAEYLARKARGGAAVRTAPSAEEVDALIKETETLERRIADLETQLRQMGDFMKALDALLASVAAQNAKLGTSEQETARIAELTEMERGLKEKLARRQAEATEEKKKELVKVAGELKTERETGILLDMEIESASEDAVRAELLRQEQQRILKALEMNVADEHSKIDELRAKIKAETARLEKQLVETQEAAAVKIERIKENTGIIQGPVNDALLDCDPRDLIAKLPARVRLLAVPLVRRICRASLLDF